MTKKNKEHKDKMRISVKDFNFLISKKLKKILEDIEREEAEA